MNTRVILLLTLGVVGVIANPVSKQTITSDNKNSPQSESIESQTKHEESTLNNGSEQKNEETINIAGDYGKRDGQVDIIIEETVVHPIDGTPQIQDEFGDDISVNNVPFGEAPINTIQDEIMETAAGFVPTPLVFRRKQKPRRRFAVRRHFAPHYFKPEPYRRKFQFFYPYYGFYHPSSLRYY